MGKKDLFEKASKIESCKNGSLSFWYRRGTAKTELSKYAYATTYYELEEKLAGCTAGATEACVQGQKDNSKRTGTQTHISMSNSVYSLV